MRYSNETPYDETVGIPIAMPIIPTGRSSERSLHHVAHPREHKLLEGAGGMAVRVAFVQMAEGPGGVSAIYNEAGEIPDSALGHPIYHRYFEGPPLPETNDQRFGYCVMALAGYTPRYGLDVSGKYPRERRIEPEEIHQLRSGEWRLGGHNHVQDFLYHYLLGDEAGGPFDSTAMADFLDTERGSERFQVGDKMLNNLILDAAQNWIRPYKEAKRRGLLSSDASPSVRELVLKALGKSTTRHGFIERLHSSLKPLQTEVKVVQLAA